MVVLQLTLKAFYPENNDVSEIIVIRQLLLNTGKRFVYAVQVVLFQP